MIRISGLPDLACCPGFWAIRDAEEQERRRRGYTRTTTSEKADTGTLVGRMIQLFHENGETAEGFEKGRATAVAEAPARADVEQATFTALRYASDKRNLGLVVADLCEREVQVDLTPSPRDPTGKPVTLLGHVDQVRRGPDGVLRVWDVKNGAPPGRDLVLRHAWQLAGYAVGLSVLLGETVLPGGIIRLAAYRVKKKTSAPEVFWPVGWGPESCVSMMGEVVELVAIVRAGKHVPLQPGPHCAWCPGKDPGSCRPRVLEILDPGNA